MSTNLSIITDALRLTGEIGETETPSAEQGTILLGRMNRMIESWTEGQIELGWFEQSLTTDTAPLPKWAEKGVASKLAQDRAAMTGAQLAPWVLDDNENGYGIIRRNAMREQLKGANNNHLPMGSGHLRSRILTDT